MVARVPDETYEGDFKVQSLDQFGRRVMCFFGELVDSWADVTVGRLFFMARGST
jgi:hypothetical protein